MAGEAVKTKAEEETLAAEATKLERDPILDPAPNWK